MDFPLTAMHVQAQAYRKHPVVVEEENTYKVRLFEWGVIAGYMNTPEKIQAMRNSMCNARSEKIVEDKKSYWRQIRSRRCVIPVSGIYEHRHIRGWKKTVPYYVKLKGRDLFCIPGLFTYSPLPDPETGELQGTFAVITRPANDTMRKIHNGGPNAGRMPLFLPKEKELEWLKPGLSDEGIQSLLDYELPADELDYWPVHTIRTTKDRPDKKEKNEPFTWEKLPELGVDDPVIQEKLF